MASQTLHIRDIVEDLNCVTYAGKTMRHATSSSLIALSLGVFRPLCKKLKYETQIEDVPKGNHLQSEKMRRARITEARP
jgi:hypothetical protein